MSLTNVVGSGSADEKLVVNDWMTEVDKVTRMESNKDGDATLMTGSVGSWFSVLFCILSLSIDYGVIMPSLWIFLRSLDPNVHEVWLGVVLSAFQISSILVSPFVGWWLDKRPMKEVLVTQLWISIAGNAMYSLSTSVPMVVVSRFICGAGSTCFLCANLYIIRTTTVTERSSAFSKLSGSQLIGLLLGPAFNYPLTQMPHLSLGWIELTPLNAVGLFMCVILLVGVVLVHTLFREPSARVALEAEQDREMSWVQKVQSIASLGTVALVVCGSVSSFNQIALESALPPITFAFWDFGQLENSLVYTALTVLLLLWYLLLGLFLTKRLSDRVLMLFAWVFVGSGVIFLVTVYMLARAWLFWQFCVGAATIASSIPFFDSTTGSLLSKMVTDPMLQGRAQSFMSSIKGLGIVAGNHPCAVRVLCS